MVTYKLNDLLPEDSLLPYFEDGDVIDFNGSNGRDPAQLAVDCSEILKLDLLHENQLDFIRTNKGDIRYMQARLMGGFVTGLTIRYLELSRKGIFTLRIKQKSRSAYGWLSNMSITQALPGISKTVDAEFPFATFICPSSTGLEFRIGPYNSVTESIGDISNEDLKQMRNKSRKIGAGAMGGYGIRKTKHKPTSRIDKRD